VFVFSDYVDMRGGFNRLSMIVREKMARNLLEGDLYLFLGKNRKRLKALCFDGTGLLLIAKRLERGNFMSLSNLEHFEITQEELDQLISGSLIRRRIFGAEALTLSRGSLNINLNAAGGSGNEHRSFSGVHEVAASPGT
jgi:transposase